MKTSTATTQNTRTYILDAPIDQQHERVSALPAPRHRSGVVLARWLLCLVILANVLAGSAMWMVAAWQSAEHASADLSVRIANIQSMAAHSDLAQPAGLAALQTQLDGANADLHTLDGVLPGNGSFDIGPERSARAALVTGLDLVAAAQSAIGAAQTLTPGLSALAQSALGTPATGTAKAGTQAQPLTLATIHRVQGDLAITRTQWQSALAERRLISTSDLVALHLTSVTPLLNSLDAQTPTVNAGLDLMSALVDASPQLAGLTGPSNFLFFDMDSDELRATGGFLGNYSLLTTQGGKLTSGFHLHDVYTLDCPKNVCPSRPMPSAQSWFTISNGHFGLRDANLDPNLPSAAWQMESLFQQESGTSVQGMIAVTPQVIAEALQALGPVQVPQFHVTVTAANLRDLLHYYHQNAQISVKLGISAQQLGTSQFKVFDVLLSQALFARLHTATPSQMAALGQAMFHGLATKDVQVFFNNTRIEGDLEQLGMAGQVYAGSGDSMFVVDTNDTGSYANADVQEHFTDAVTLDASGAARHALTVDYTYPSVQHTYAQDVPYGDLVRVIVPAAAVRTQVNGPCTPVSAPEAGHAVLACQFSVSRGASVALHFTWVVPHVASVAHGYTFTLQRQAGAHVSGSLTVAAAPALPISTVTAPATLKKGTMTWSGALETDTHFAVTFAQ